MFEWIKSFVRRRELRNAESKVSTRLTPLSGISSAVAFIDEADPCSDKCKEALQVFFRTHGIKGEIFFFDFRKISSQERLITSIATTVLKKDLLWTGRPSNEIVRTLLGSNPDMFISLIREDCYALEYMAKCSEARFKVGLKQLEGSTFDLVLSPDENMTTDEVFARLVALMEKIS